MKGSLVRTPFSRILRHLARSKETGSLYLLKDSVKKVVLFEYGLPIFVRSNQVEECLGQILVSDGLITLKQCEQTLETMRRTGKQQGRLLVEMGLISEGNLRYGLETQIREKLFDIFTWTDGRYHFKEEPLERDLGVQLHLSSASLIVSGILERLNSGIALAKLEPVLSHHPLRAGNEPLDLELQANERYFLETLDGSRTVKEILDSKIEPPVAMPALLLHALIQAGLCRLSAKATEAKTPPPPPRNPTDIPDIELLPGFDPTASRTEFEDTPLPGLLPGSAAPRGPSEAMLFDDNARSLIDDTLSDVKAQGEFSSTFENEVLQLDDDELELIDEEAYDLDDAITEGPESLMEPDAVDADQLISTDDDEGLSAIDLALEDLSSPDPDDEPAQGSTREGEALFDKAQQALQASDWKSAIEGLEQAYEAGFDLATLHADLAFARFQFSGQDPALVEHALELLDYAQEMDPDLDRIYAYRAAVFFSEKLGDESQQQASKALELNPDNALATQVLAGEFGPS